jgi:hypothetical protein
MPERGKEVPTGFNYSDYYQEYALVTLTFNIEGFAFL